MPQTSARIIAAAALFLVTAIAAVGGSRAVAMESAQQVTELALLPPAQPWQRWGSGDTRFLGFKLYRASLWIAPDPRPQGVADASPENRPTDPTRSTHALVLRYERDFSRATLVEASLREMKRVGASDAELVRWEADLNRVFPDVRAGEAITGVHLPGRHVVFLHQGKLTGQVDDPAFARRFFGIWLDPRTRDPELRTRLLAGPDRQPPE